MLENYKIEDLKLNLSTYLQTITRPDKKAGHNMYQCPLCGSGSKNTRNSDGAFSITKDGKFWKCFSCNKSGDLFTLIGLHENIKDFKNQVKYAANLSGFNISPDNSENHRNYIEICKSQALNTDYFKTRGFNNKIIKRFNLGYDKNKKAIVIPYDSKGSYYITRSTESKQFRKPKNTQFGNEPVYNKAALYSNKPCFVTESPIDAISLIIAGENSCSAIALGGTGINKLIEQIKIKPPTCNLILSFDNDSSGEKATLTAIKELSKLNIPFITAKYNLEAYKYKKDANDLFRANPEQLKLDVQANIQELERLINAEKIAKLEAHNSSNGAERLKDFLNGIKEKANTSYIPTGFSELDNQLDGGLYPGLYILGAISSLGKTTLLLQIADQIASLGKDVLYFSLEMAANELISKSISRHTYKLCGDKTNNAKTARGITTASRYKNYSSTEKELIKNAISEYSSYAKNIYIYEGIGNIGVQEIKQKVQEHKELTNNTPLVFIDYIQILSPHDIRASDKQNTDKAVLELKRLSRDFKTTVIGISSFNRDNYSTEVNMAAFKESGAIEYGSDVLLALQPQGMKPGYTATDQKENSKLIKACKSNSQRSVEAVILKNRNGKTGGKVGFKYNALFNCFEQDLNFDSFDSDVVIENDYLLPFGTGKE